MTTSTKMKLKAAGLLGAGVLSANVLFGCKNPSSPTPNVCECPAGTTHEPGEKCCEGEDCECAIAEPATKSFVITLFEGASTTVQDARTECGSKNLAEIGITTQIQDIIILAYDAGGNATKNRFGNIFKDVYANDTVIIVDNITEYYEGPKTPEKYKMNLHIDYLKSNPEDFQQKMNDAILYMNNMPYVAKVKAVSKTIIAEVPQSRAVVSQRLALNRLMMRQRG